MSFNRAGVSARFQPKKVFLVGYIEDTFQSSRRFRQIPTKYAYSFNEKANKFQSSRRFRQIPTKKCVKVIDADGVSIEPAFPPDSNSAPEQTVIIQQGFNRAGVSARFQRVCVCVCVCSVWFQSSRRFRQIPTRDVLRAITEVIRSFNRAGVSARFQHIGESRHGL